MAVGIKYEVSSSSNLVFLFGVSSSLALVLQPELPHPMLSPARQVSNQPDSWSDSRSCSFLCLIVTKQDTPSIKNQHCVFQVVLVLPSNPITCQRRSVTFVHGKIAT